MRNQYMEGEKKKYFENEKMEKQVDGITSLL